MRYNNNDRFDLYVSLGFEVVHNDIVIVNPSGAVPIEIDFSAVSESAIMSHAIEKAYSIGKSSAVVLQTPKFLEHRKLNW
jgi:hypothetical protein